MPLYWEPKNFGRIACEKHVGGSAGEYDKLTKEDYDFFESINEPVKCEDCP